MARRLEAPPSLAGLQPVRSSVTPPRSVNPPVLPQALEQSLPLPATNMRQLPYTISSASTDVRLRVTPVRHWAKRLGWMALEQDEEAASLARLQELKLQAKRTQAELASKTKMLRDENSKLLAMIADENIFSNDDDGLKNFEMMRWVNQKMQDAGNQVYHNDETILSVERTARQALESNTKEAVELRINLPVDIEVSPTETVKLIRNQLQKYFSDDPYHQDAMQDTIELWLDCNGRSERLGSRTTATELRFKWIKMGGSQDRPITLSMDVYPGCLGSGSGTCLEWSFLLGCCFLSLVFAGLLAVVGTMLFTPGVRSNLEDWEHLAFVGSFFGVLATCSVVFCIWFLLPRYTERRGPRGVFTDQAQLESLERETWVWSFSINGKGARLKILHGCFLAWVKFQQLFALTYQPEIIDRSSMPKVVIALGDYVLFDLDKLTEEKNSTLASKLSTLSISSNVSNPFTDFIELSPYDRYYWKTVTFMGVCGVMMLIIMVTKVGGCLEGRGSEAAQNITVGIVGLISSFFTIPLYRHLLSGLDCTYRPTGMGANKTDPGFEWDPAAGVFTDSAGPETRECYGAWAAVDMGVDSVTETEEADWTAFNFMIFGMIGLCMFQWPITLYLMVRPDSERDDEEAGLLIADAVIRAKQLHGRTLRESTSDEPRDSHESLLEREKRCCRGRRRKPTLVGYTKDSEAFAELEKMYKLSVDESTLTGTAVGKSVEGKLKVTEGVEINAQGQMFTKVPVHPKGGAGAKIRISMKHPDEESALVNTVPRMNRLELRDYAARTDFIESADAEADSAGTRFIKPVTHTVRGRSVLLGGWDVNDEVLAIDHRKCCGTRDLDSATLGVSGPKRRPREAAVNFGLEIAIVVVSVLFSGRAEILGGQLELGHHCFDPLGSDPQLRSTSDGSARNALPLFVDVGNTASAQEYYQDWCNDYSLRNETSCESPLGWFPPTEADGNDEFWRDETRCNPTARSLGIWADDDARPSEIGHRSSVWAAVLQRWFEICRYDPDVDSSKDCIAASLETYGPTWHVHESSMDVDVMRRAACANYCKDQAIEMLVPGQSACCQFRIVDNGQWVPPSDDPSGECQVFQAAAAPNPQLLPDFDGDKASMILNVTTESLKHGWRCQWGPRKVTVIEAKLFALSVMHFIMALYFCNPLTLIGGEVFCSPYRNKAQTDSRTSLIHLGYPYNFEPLNFMRGAMSMVCSSFAAFQILAWRRVFPNEHTAISDWGLTAVGCVAVYLAGMLIRLFVFRRHLRHSVESPEGSPSDAALKAVQP